MDRRTWLQWLSAGFVEAIAACSFQPVTPRGAALPGNQAGAGASATGAHRVHSAAVESNASSGASPLSLDLTELVAAAGLHWIWVANPQQTLQTLDQETPGLVTKERLDAFSASTGLDLKQCTQAVVAGYANSTLYVTRAEGSSAHIALAVAEATLKNTELTEDTPPPTTERDELACFPINADIAAVTLHDPLPGKAAQAFAAGRLKRSPAALHGTSLGQLPAQAHSGLVRFYCTGALPEFASHPLLNRVDASCLSLDVRDARLKMRLFLAGDFSTVEEAELRTLLHRVMHSELGSLLTLTELSDSCPLRREHQNLIFECEFDAARVLRAAHGVLESRVDLVIDLDSKTP